MQFLKFTYFYQCDMDMFPLKPQQLSLGHLRKRMLWMNYLVPMQNSEEFLINFVVNIMYFVQGYPKNQIRS